MDLAPVLVRFDHEMRREPVVGPPFTVERSNGLVRIVGPEDVCVVYSRPGADTVRSLIASEQHRIGGGPRELEWKVYSHDPPVGLPEALASAGFRPTPLEILMVLPLESHRLSVDLPPGATVRRITDRSGLADAVAVEVGAFGRDSGHLGRHVGPRLADPDLGLFVAYLDGQPVASGRIEMAAGQAFAGLWGGGTIPAARHRGFYRALVAARAELAQSRGFEYVFVEARDSTSRPILEQLGFTALSQVVGWVWTDPG